MLRLIRFSRIVLLPASLFLPLQAGDGLESARAVNIAQGILMIDQAAAKDKEPEQPKGKDTHDRITGDALTLTEKMK